jgi:hypothetical protein
MITAYRSDTIRNQHRDDYDNDLRAGGLADGIKCPHCSIEYSFIVPTARLKEMESIRSKAVQTAGHEHPQHFEASILVPES